MRTAMKIETVGAYRLVSTSAPESGVVVYLQEKKNGKWVFILDSNGFPMQSNKIGYMRGVAEGRIRYGQESHRSNVNHYEPTTRKQIIKELREKLRIGYFQALMLTFKHINRWGYPHSAFIIALKFLDEAKQKTAKP